MTSQKDLVMQQVEEYFKDYRKRNFGALKDWTAIEAEEFARVPIETLIRDPYFLGLKDKVYDGVLEDILDLFEERKRRQVNLAIFLEGIGSGKCISRDSIILTQNGFKKVENLKPINSTPDSFSDLRINVQTRNGFKESSRFYENSETQGLRIRTHLGYEIKGTLNHPIWNHTWVKLKDLKIGDKVGILIKDENWNGTQKYSLDEAYLMGYHLGDGHLHDNGYPGAGSSSQFTIDKNETEFKNYIYELASKIGMKITTLGDKRRGNFRFRLHWVEDINSYPLTSKWPKELWGNIFEKQIPSDILLNKELLKAFIQGWFDADGSINKDGNISISSVNRDLARILHIILSNFGIISTLRLKKTKCNEKSGITWRIKINSNYADLFMQRIGFRMVRKINDYNENKKTRTGSSFKLEDNIYYDEIEEIEVINDKFYDLEIPEIHEFVANSIICHNTVKASIINWLLWFELTLCTPSPQEYFDLAPNSVIALINLNRCISGDSLIISNQGIKRIDSLFHEDFFEKTFESISGIKLSGYRGVDNVESIYFNGYSKVKKIILRNGLELSGTLDHKVLTKDGYKIFNDLKVNDEVVCQYNQQMFGNNNLIDSELAYVLGVLTGDGALGHKRGYVKWCSIKSESEHSEYCKKIINDRFSNGYDMVSRKDYDDRNVYMYSVQFSARKKFRKLLDDIGMGTGAHNKKVPECILEAPKDVQIQFIRGLFDTDGSATKGSLKVKVTSVSKELMTQVQIMLLNLGIISSLRKRMRHSWVYTLYILGIHANTFKNEIGFFIKRKQKVLEDSINKKTRNFYESRKWINNVLWYVPIIDIQYGEDYTYDVTMTNDPSFCSMGIMNHNSEKQAKKVTFAETFPRFQCPFNQDYFPPSDKFTSEIRIPRNNTTIFPGTSSAL